MKADEAVDQSATTPCKRVRRAGPDKQIELSRCSLVEYAERNFYRLSDKSSIPIYYQLFRLCGRCIFESHLQPGDRFPSEETIAKSFGVSRSTAHRAIHELLAREWLVRQRGRGTFVAERKHLDLTFLSGKLSFSDQYTGNGQLSSQVVHLRRGKASREVANALHLSEGDPVYCLQRLRRIDGRPFLLEDSYLSVDQFPGLDSHELVEGSLTGTLLALYETQISRCERWVQASEALGENTAIHLQISVLSPILLLHGVGYTESNIPVVFMKAYVREGVSFRSVDRSHARSLSPTRSYSTTDSGRRS